MKVTSSKLSCISWVSTTSQIKEQRLLGLTKYLVS